MFGVARLPDNRQSVIAEGKREDSGLEAGHSQLDSNKALLRLVDL